MSTNRFALGAVGIAALALFMSWWPSSFTPATSSPPMIVGSNNTALFLVGSDYGLSNVHLATAHALLECHPHIRIHFASFAPMAERLERISSYFKATDKRDVVFHQIDGSSVIEACRDAGKNTSNSIHPPGWSGIGHLCKDMQLFVSPWTGEAHLAIYDQVTRIIETVNPAVVVLDTQFRPAIDATRDKNRLHAIISPNTLIENFIAEQPWGKMFWKYPAMGSGFTFPIPWSKIPENILLNFRFISAMLYMPDIAEKQAFLKSKGLQDPINFLRLHRPNVPWLSQTMPGASWPVDVIPTNVTCTGPMTLSLATAAEQDGALTEWLTGAPTILINLGSGFEYPEAHAIAMAHAIARVLRDTDAQVLWKFRAETPYSETFSEPLAPFVTNGRVKVVSWLTADPPSLLESGHIIASVHHGGSGCYHEAISAGVPQVIFPLWLDLYGFAQLSESIGVGVWGCRNTSPHWTVECVHEAILDVVHGNKSTDLKEKAGKLAMLAQKKPGRYIAAREIARLAGSGDSRP